MKSLKGLNGNEPGTASCLYGSAEEPRKGKLRSASPTPSALTVSIIAATPRFEYNVHADSGRTSTRYCPAPMCSAVAIQVVLAPAVPLDAPVTKTGLPMRAEKSSEV